MGHPYSRNISTYKIIYITRGLDRGLLGMYGESVSYRNPCEDCAGLSMNVDGVHIYIHISLMYLSQIQRSNTFGNRPGRIKFGVIRLSYMQPSQFLCAPDTF